MTSLTKDGVTYYFEYDNEGHRVKKTVGDKVTNYYYSGDLLIAEESDNRTVLYLYDNNAVIMGYRLDRSSGFTKSTASAGREIHRGYKATSEFDGYGKEFGKIKGIRPDYIDFNTRTIYELEPMNPQGIKNGIRQSQKYNKALGGGYTMRLELY